MTILGIGLAVVTAGVIATAAASKSITVVSIRELREYSTSAYDILVRPSDSRSAIERESGFVEPNHLSGLDGGITFAQYKTVRSIPGVEVAAPIAMVGYLSGFVQTEELGTLTQPGFYVLEEEIIVSDGVRMYQGPDFTRRTYYFNPPADLGELPMSLDYVFVNWTEPITGFFDFPFLLAGIDPVHEAALIGLDKAMVGGEYLSSLEPLHRRGNPFRLQSDDPVALIDVPVLVNQQSYVDVTIRAALNKARVDPHDPELIAALSRVDRQYLNSLPMETVALHEAAGDEAYSRLVDSLLEASEGVHKFPLTLPAPTEYQEATLPIDYDGLTLRLIPDGGPGYGAYLTYRPFTHPGEFTFDSAFKLAAKGVFDIEQIPRPAEIVEIPLETYFPPSAVLRFDLEGKPVPDGKALGPTLNPAGYIQPPPLMLTTLEAAMALRGEDAISAIRVRVSGIDQLTPASQRKIEAVASAISQLTGLTVDIMAGSSPTRVLVEVPEIGYVEELWIQKGANLLYQEKIQAGHWLIFAALLAAAGVFTMDIAWADVLARERTIGIQRAVGWRSREVVGEVMRRILVTTLLAIAVGGAAGIAIATAGGWDSPPGMLATIAAGGLFASTLGAAYPARRAAKIPPVLGIQSAGISPHASLRRSGLGGLWGYALESLSRRATETILSCAIASLSSALFVLMTSVIVEREGMLGLTLLGEFILARVGPTQLLLVLAALVLATFATANTLHARAVERRHVIGTLRALGWSRRHVVALSLREGLIIGTVGGIVGAVPGLVWYAHANATMPSSVLLIGFLAVSAVAVAGALAGVYPGLHAAGVPPAQALRSA
jgi:hypothetical protein